MIARLGDICKINMGQSPDSSSYNDKNDGLPFFQGNADFGELYPTVRVWCSQPSKVANKNDILISVRAPIGALNIADCECCIGRGIAALTVDENACFQKYLWHALHSKVDVLNSNGTGSKFKEINKRILEETEIPLPTRDEQRKIAAVLDKISDLAAKRRRQLDKLDELVKSRFVEMFGDSETNTHNLPVLPWCDVFKTTTGKLDSNAMVDGGQYPFFTCAKEVFAIDDYAFDCEALLLAGNNAAGVYDVKHYSGKFNAYQRTYVLRLNNDKWSYPLFQRQLEYKLQYLQKQSRGTNTRYLTLGILNQLHFLIPSVEDQHCYDVFIDCTDKIVSKVNSSIAMLETLKKSLMQEYFSMR